MNYRRTDPRLLVFVLALLAMLLAYLALHHELLDVIVRCGQLCGSLMAEPVIRMLSK